MNIKSIINSISRLIHYLTKDNSIPEKPKRKQVSPLKTTASKRAIDEVFNKPDIDLIPQCLREKYNCNSNDELFDLLMTKKYDHNQLTDEEEAYINLDEFEELRNWYEFSITVANESMRGQAMAINDLIKGRYEINIVEAGNPMKELLNPVLTLLKDAFYKNPNNTMLTIKQHFPLSGKYIYAFIQEKIPTPSKKRVADPYLLYNEFLRFYINYLLQTYPTKKQRDTEIRNNFRFMPNRMMELVDEQEQIMIAKLN